MENNNFTSSDIWKQSNKIRYDIDNIVSLCNIDFLIREKDIQCLQFFNVRFTNNLLKLLKSTIVNNKNVIFKYINLTNEQINKLSIWCNFNNLKLKIIDEWDAPLLNLNTTLENYIISKGNSIKKDFIKYKKDTNLSYKVFNGSLDLWTSVLKIDKRSWKGKSLCDMKSLDREDLQYVFYLMNNPNNSSLMVCFDNDEPVSYSLMLKSDNDLWYAAKWGASDNGRLLEAGIKVLFNHINFLNEKQNHNLKLDLWGRRSQFYDLIKSDDRKRYHIEIGNLYD